jgi:two-component system, OmpR family, sensor kinase
VRLRRPSLRALLFAATSAVVVLSVGLTVAIGLTVTRREVERATLRDVSHQADLLAERERVALVPCARINERSLKLYFARQQEKAHCAALKKLAVYLPGDRSALLRKKAALNGTVTVNGTTYFYAARSLGNRAFVLLRPKSLGSTAFRPFLVGLLIAGAAGATLAALISFLLARRLARPVRRVVEAARSLGEAKTPEHVPVEGAAELADLARAFNEMADQLEKARTAERSFLLSVSHELKTPLTAIRGYAEGVSDGAFSGDEVAKTIESEAARLERLVGDLLDLARMNKSEFSVHKEPFDLGTIARDAVQRYETQARSFNVTLEASVPGAAPATGDADRTLQIASNLVENALRLTPAGGVVRVLAEPGQLTVEDTGPGLAPEDIDRAFERFYLHSRYGGERPVGTGLGLAIVKELVEGMGGTVEVESEPGHGTRFTVHLPFYGALTSAEPSADGPGRPVTVSHPDE